MCGLNSQIGQFKKNLEEEYHAGMELPCLIVLFTFFISSSDFFECVNIWLVGQWVARGWCRSLIYNEGLQARKQ